MYCSESGLEQVCETGRKAEKLRPAHCVFKLERQGFRFILPQTGLGGGKSFSYRILCACPDSCCCPVLGSNHKLLTLHNFHIAHMPASTEDVPPCWPVVRDWRPVVRAFRGSVSDWSAKFLNHFREVPCLAPSATLVG